MDRDITANLKVRHMALIAALAEHGTTRRAAEALNMTQSTASKMLGDLEENFDACLFERNPRGLSPTPLGEFVIESVRAQLSHLQRFSEEFQARRSGGYGTLTVGAISGAAPDIVAKAVADIKRKRPQLMVSLHGETSDEILDLLEIGQLDLAVGRLSAERQRHLFSFEPLTDEPLTIVARTGHPLAQVRVMRLADLVECAWVLQPLSNPSRQALDSAFDNARLPRPKDTIDCSSILLTLHIIQVTDAVALLPESVVASHLKAGLFREMPITPAIRLTKFGLVTRRKEALGEAALEFCDILRARTRSSPKAQP